MTLKEELTKIVSDHDLIKVTYDWFWKNYDSYLEESPEEAAEYGLTDKDSVSISLRSTAYVISDFKTVNDEKYEYIEISIEMFDKQKKYIGYYDALFNLDGTWSDDFFVLGS